MPDHPLKRHTAFEQNTSHRAVGCNPEAFDPAQFRVGKEMNYRDQRHIRPALLQIADEAGRMVADYAHPRINSFQPIHQRG